MDSHWPMLLLLLLGGRALHLPGTAAVLGNTHSINSAVSPGTISCPPLSTALTHDHTSTDETISSSITSTSTSKPQEQTSTALPMSPPTSSSTGSTELTAPTPETLENISRTIASHTSVTVTTGDIPPASSMNTSTWTNQGVMSGTTTSSSMATTAMNMNQEQMTLMTTPSASEPTTTQGITILSTTMTETQGEITTVPLTLATTLVTSKPSDAQHSTTQQTSVPPAEPTSGVGTTLGPAPSTSKPTSSGLASSAPPGSEKAVTAPTAISTSEHDINPSESVITTVSATLALTSIAVEIGKDTNESLSTTTVTVIHTSSPNTATLGTTVLETTMSKTQEEEATAVPPTQATTPSKSKPSESQSSIVQQTLSPPIQSTSSSGPDTAQSREPTPDHSTALLVPAFSKTTKSSAMAEASPQAGVCALDEYRGDTGGCMCNSSYYANSELSRELMTLHCLQQDIKVSFSSCFLKTHHWVLKPDAFLGCSSTEKIEQGRWVQSYQLEKKEGTCGLQLSTNTSHALYSVEVQLVQELPGSKSRMLNFSCAYPLEVNVSQTLSDLLDPNPYSTIHIPSTGQTIVTLHIFIDSSLSSPLGNRTAVIGTALYMVLRSTNSDPVQFALVVNEAFASTNLSKTGVKDTYYFVNNSCPVGNRLAQDLKVNGAAIQVTVAFILQRFFKSDALYLHARVSLCPRRPGRSCRPPCNQENPEKPLRRNSPWRTRTQERGRGEWVVFGPLRISEPKASSSGSSAGTWMSIFLLMVIGWMLG